LKILRLILLLLAFLSLPVTVFAVPERLVVLPPTVYPENPENRAVIHDVVRRAAARADDLFASYISVDFDQDRKDQDRGDQSRKDADFTVRVEAFFQDPNDIVKVTLVRSRDGAEGSGIPLLGTISSRSAVFLANSIFHQWSSFHDFLADEMTEAPLYIDEVPLDLISRSLFGNTGMLAPWSLALRDDSTFLVGTATVCLEMDRNFRVLDQPGRELYDAGEYGYGSIVDVTPAGTIFFKNLNNGKVIKWLGSGTRAQSWKLGSQYLGSFAVFPDGSALAVHAGQQKTVLLKDRKPTPVDFLTDPNLYISALAAGPDGDVWVYSVAERRIRIYTSQGQLVDSIIPISPLDLVPTQMQVYPDGSFIFFSQGTLARFRRNGVPLWSTDKLLGPGEFASLSHAYVAGDSKTGLIYLSDVTGRRIIKLLDRSYARSRGISNPAEETLLRHNERLSQNPDDVAALADKAAVYEQIGSIEMARSLWNQVLEIDPLHSGAKAKVDGFEIALLKNRASDLEDKTRSTIEALGPESARQFYSQTMQLYEKILSLDPGDRDTIQKRRDLNLLFAEKQKRITITAAQIENLFPSMMQHYRSAPVGTVTVHNVLDEEARDLTASVFIERYMDFPTESSPLSRLRPGGRATLDLNVVFNTSVFDLQEDLPVQARIEISYRTAGVEQRSAKVVGLRLFRKTALTWDDSAKLASFIMPNEEIVSTFSHRVSDIEAVQRRYRLSKRLFRGIRVCDALGAYGIAYIEDPDSPISKVLGKPAVVDTVRFPRTTLLIQSGDCDDTTALLGSLLESVGVSTAIMTTPGHVFLAFETGEPKENLWLFRHGEFEAIAHEGTIWLPVETTVLDKGFLSAWETASRLVRRHRNRLEFLPVGAQRDRYPPLPLPGTELSVFEPAAEEIDALFSVSIGGIEDTLYEESLRTLEKKLQQQRGSRAVRLRNQIGVLHARFGKDVEAEAALKRCLSEDPDFPPAYLNLANLKFVRGEIEEAAGVARRGLERSPEFPLLNIFLAIYHHRKGEPQEAGRYLERVRAASPELAERYSYLAEGGTAKVRAGAAAESEELPLIWTSGE